MNMNMNAKMKQKNTRTLGKQDAIGKLCANPHDISLKLNETKGLPHLWSQKHHRNAAPWCHTAAEVLSDPLDHPLRRACAAAPRPCWVTHLFTCENQGYIISV